MSILAQQPGIIYSSFTITVVVYVHEGYVSQHTGHEHCRCLYCTLSILVQLFLELLEIRHDQIWRIRLSFESQLINTGAALSMNTIALPLSSDNGDAVSPCAENACLGNQSYLIRDRKASLHCRSGGWAWLITVSVCCGYSNWPTLLSVTDAGGYASCNWSIILLPFQAGRNKS